MARPLIKRARLSFLDRNPFPLCRGYFGHNNIIVDDTYHIIGVIDWKTAFAGPREIFADFPLTLSTVPPAMDAPGITNQDGSPKAADLTQKLADQEDCVEAVAAGKNRGGGDNHRLSETLRESQRRQLATTVRLYRNGKPGWYNKVVPDLD